MTYTMNFRTHIRHIGRFYRAVLERQIVRDDGHAFWSVARILGPARHRHVAAIRDADDYADREGFDHS